MPADLLPIVAVSGFLDGIHPCGFAVLLFFIAFLFTLKQTREKIFRMGAVYIFGVFLAYFLIGVGLFSAIAITNQPHFMAKLGALLLLFLGLVNIKDYFWYGKWFTLAIPTFSKGFIHSWIRKATLPAAFVAGFLVGLCAFPCVGGIYVAILGLIAASKIAGLEAMAFIVVYNLMFVMPLILMLLLASNKRVVEKMEQWERAEKREIKLFTGLVMIALGLFILYGGFLA